MVYEPMEGQRTHILSWHGNQTSLHEHSLLLPWAANNPTQMLTSPLYPKESILCEITEYAKNCQSQQPQMLMIFLDFFPLQVQLQQALEQQWSVGFLFQVTLSALMCVLLMWKRKKKNPDTKYFLLFAHLPLYVLLCVKTVVNTS